jgi:hypothetical protein
MGAMGQRLAGELGILELVADVRFEAMKIECAISGLDGLGRPIQPKKLSQ